MSSTALQFYPRSENKSSVPIARVSMKKHCGTRHRLSRRKREKKKRRRRRRRRRRSRWKVARTEVEPAYRCQRDKTNHRNNHRPPQPAFHHGHLLRRCRMPVPGLLLLSDGT
ncbi:hypothetical protein PUN28_003849 [Cardiocondyla obscurior]|uniref:Uncharacterized protein n=1 Tax=Cardiocondyla obscurior TaxID=286306 RepID=A0AAW2GNP1_9HYME